MFWFPVLRTMLAETELPVWRRLVKYADWILDGGTGIRIILLLCGSIFAACFVATGSTLDFFGCLIYFWLAIRHWTNRKIIAEWSCCYDGWTEIFQECRFQFRRFRYRKSMRRIMGKDK